MVRHFAASGAALLLAALLVDAACVGVSGLAGGETSPADGGSDDGRALVTLGLSIKPAALDFGPAGCGTQVPAQSVTLENTTEAAIHYEASLPEASGFVLGGQHLTTVSGDIPAHGVAVLTIGVVSFHTLGPLATKLSIRVGEQITDVPIRVSGLGAKLEVEPKIVDFGDVYYQVSSVAEVTLRNTGTEALTVTGLANLRADFAVPNTTFPLLIGPNEKKTISVSLVAGMAGSPLTSDAAIAIDPSTPVCGDPLTLSVRARRVDADLTLNPGTLDFGPQGCLTKPPAKQVTLTNYAPVPINVAAATVTGSRYTIAPSGPSTVPASNGAVPGKVVFTVTPAPLAAPLGGSDETFQIDCGAKGVKTSTLHVDVRGVILSISPLAAAFTVDQTKYFSVKNLGNENALTVYKPPNSAWTITPGDTIFPNTASNLSVTYTKAGAGTYDGVITTTLSSGGPLCAPAPTVTVEEK